MARTKKTVRLSDSYNPDPLYCGKRPTVLWDKSIGQMKEIIHTYYGQNRPYNRSRGLALIKNKVMPKLRGRQTACDTLYYLSRPVLPTAKARTLPVQAFAPKKIYLKHQRIPRKLKCRAGNVQCGDGCISVNKKCWVAYNPAQKRYMTKAEIAYLEDELLE